MCEQGSSEGRRVRSRVVTRAVATREIVTRRAKEGSTGGLRRGSGEVGESIRQESSADGRRGDVRRSVEKRCEEGLRDCVQGPQMRRVRLGGLKEGSEGGLGRRVCKEAGFRRGDATTAAKLVRGEWEEGDRGGGGSQV